MKTRSLTALLAAREAGVTRQSAPGRRRAADGEDVAGALRSWAEADSLRHCSASYCPLSPSPRSTIAAAFSPDGTLLASTQCAPRGRPPRAGGRLPAREPPLTLRDASARAAAATTR